MAGRAGESFISPDEQRAAIEAWAKGTGTEILEWHEDLDQSGGTLDRPGFKAALEQREHAPLLIQEVGVDPPTR